MRFSKEGYFPRSRSVSTTLELVWTLLSDRVLANFVLDDEGKICIAVAMEILSEEVQEKIGRTEIETLNPHELYFKEVQEKIGRTEIETSSPDKLLTLQ